MNRLMKVLTYPMRQQFEGAIKHIIRNVNVAPECCGKPMEYIDEHRGLYMNTQIYQCGQCKKIELLHKHDWEK